jgi:hypothetical protein
MLESSSMNETEVSTLHIGVFSVNHVPLHEILQIRDRGPFSTQARAIAQWKMRVCNA